MLVSSSEIFIDELENNEIITVGVLPPLLDFLKCGSWNVFLRGVVNRWWTFTIHNLLPASLCVPLMCLVLLLSNKLERLTLRSKFLRGFAGHPAHSERASVRAHGAQVDVPVPQMNTLDVVRVDSQALCSNCARLNLRST